MWNFLPVIHLLLVIATALLAPGWWKSAALFVLYLVPPVMVRGIRRWHPVVAGTHALDSTEFFAWWATAQCQMIFCRMPVLEEWLRMVPGLYSLWLRLWGARIGRLTFWSPELRVLDRSWLVVGDHVVFGAGVRLNAHVIAVQDGRRVLHLAPITIGSGSHVGGYALLTAGTTIGEREEVHAFALCPPFSQWRAGRRHRPARPA
jgi:hypothetical protein